HVGYPQDWTERQIVFSRDGLARHPGLMEREPRVRNQARQRWQTQSWAASPDIHPRPILPYQGIDRDWNVTLEGHVRQNMFPAKYVFDPGEAPSCENDYVVFGLNIAGVTGGAANLVAFNNLYVNGAGTGLCAGLTAPTVLFAYNVSTVGGKILTSPVLSLDGTQIIFVESVTGNPSSAVFHVLTWTAGQGQPDISVAPTQMTSLPYSPTTGPGNADTGNTLSSPWIDYSSGTVYVGANNGLLYQITDALTTPTLSGGNWPIDVSYPYYNLTSPVLDAGLGLLMVGSTNGNLYSIGTASGVVVGDLPVGSGLGSGFLDPPIVDVTNGTTFVVNSNYQGGAALVEVDSTNLSTPLATAQIGIGSANTGATRVKIYQPAFSNSYYNLPSSGVVTVCGTGATDTTPYQYEFGFVGRTLDPSVFSFSRELSLSVSDSCTGWTEFFNPNVGTGGTDFFFFGLTGDCTLLPGGAGVTTGCVVEVTSDPFTQPLSVAVSGGPSGIVVDNYSTEPQASSIYFTAATADTAYKFTQDGLN
ncbi:MAG: hypothetical protein WAL58_05285, partial [Terriglobales bacterium]